MPQNDRKHAHSHDHGTDGTSCGAGGDAMCGDIGPVGDVNANGGSFRVNGLDCADEVAILNKVLGPEVGGTEHLAFDVINGRMTVLDSGKALTDEKLIKLVGSTGKSAKPWDADIVAADLAAHLKRQKFFTALNGGFWAAGFLYHVVIRFCRSWAGGDAAGRKRPFPGRHRVWCLAGRPKGVVFGAAAVTRHEPVDDRGSRWRNLAGEYFEAATVAFFFSLSLYLESWSVGRARNAAAALLDLAPPTAWVIRRDGSEEDVLAAQVVVGDRFVVRGGDHPLSHAVVELEALGGCATINSANKSNRPRCGQRRLPA